MAKRTASGVNKSQAIRDYLEKNPGATPNQIVAGVKEESGLTVSVGLASNVKYTMGNRRKVRRKKVSIRSLSPRTGRGRRPAGGISTEDLLETKRLVDQMGGTDQLRRALEVLEQLQ